MEHSFNELAAMLDESGNIHYRGKSYSVEGLAAILRLINRPHVFSRCVRLHPIGLRTVRNFARRQRSGIR